MEAVGEAPVQPPPVPPKVKRDNCTLQITDQSRMKNFSDFCRNLIMSENEYENTTLKSTNAEGEGRYLGPSNTQSVWMSMNGKPNYDDHAGTNSITTWVETSKESLREGIYENVSGLEGNRTENELKWSVGNEKPGTVLCEKSNQRRKKTPKIEVLQEDFKTVVKISIKDTPTPEDENRMNLTEGNLYENAFQRANGRADEAPNGNCNGTVVRHESNPDEVVYENLGVLKPNYLEKVANGTCSLILDEHLYENLEGNDGQCNQKNDKMDINTERNYCNVNGSDLVPNKVYANELTLGKTKMENYKNTKERDKEENEVYEDVENDNIACKVGDSYEQVDNPSTMPKRDEAVEPEAEKKGSSFVELTMQKPKSKYKMDDSFSGDPFDSGTSSDVDSLPTFVQTKRGNVIVTIKNFQGEDLKKDEVGHRRAESLTSSGVGVDSEESDDDKSNISCDSLNSSEPYPPSNSEDHGYHTPNFEDKTGSPVDRIVYENVLITSQVQSKDEQLTSECNNFESGKSDEKPKIPCDSVKLGESVMYLNQVLEPSDFEEYENVYVFQKKLACGKKKAAPPPPPPPLVDMKIRESKKEEEEDEDEEKALPKNLLNDIRSKNVRLSSTFPNGQSKEDVKSPVAQVIQNLESSIPRMDAPPSTKQAERPVRKPNLQDNLNKKQSLVIEERAYEDRKPSVTSVKVNRICAMEVDTDQFYKFHLSENFREDEGKDEETFAGVKDYLSREKSAAITSAKGTIRGVKNRVKAGIATFLQMHENKSYKDKDAGKVVVYTTTMGIVRETYQKCLKVKQILRTLMVKFEERDVFMSSEAQEEIRFRMKCKAILVPQVFVEGQHIGDAETIDRLNEMGELRTILKPYKSLDACSTCKVCGGYRLLPCGVCKGSKKSIHRNHFTAEFVSLKCMNCDQVGLIKCHAC